jgi:hypothetical protein
MLHSADVAETFVTTLSRYQWIYTAGRWQC